VTTDEIINAVAGNSSIFPSAIDSDGGPALSAQLWLLQSAAVDCAGTLFIGPYANCRNLPHYRYGEHELLPRVTFFHRPGFPCGDTGSRKRSLGVPGWNDGDMAMSTAMTTASPVSTSLCSSISPCRRRATRSCSRRRPSTRAAFLRPQCRMQCRMGAPMPGFAPTRPTASP
jgi:hypothetical protein